METNPEEYKKHKMTPKAMAFGLMVIGLGLALLLRNIGWLSETVEDIIFSWGMLIAAFGVLQFLDRHRYFGGILVVIGALFILNDVYGLPVTFHNVFWPAMIILAGLLMIFGSGRRRCWKNRSIHTVTEGDDYFEEMAVFGGGERTIHSQSFKGGKIIAVFGGSKLNLSEVTLGPGPCVIEIVAIFGGTAMIIPSDWHVKTEIVPIFGGYSDKRFKTQVDYSKTLIVKGITIFGGGEIKSA